MHESRVGEALDHLQGLSAEIQAGSREPYHAFFCDPPYGLSDLSPQVVLEAVTAWAKGERYEASGKGFMGHAWDAFVPGPEYWRALAGTLYPGAYGLVYAGTRTQDLMALALRLGGFEVRDTLMWIYASGFPKSHNVALGIDKTLGHKDRGRAIPTASKRLPEGRYAREDLTSNPVVEYEPRTPEAAPWVGHGTALKPAYEPVLLVRKPLSGTVAETAQTYGTGTLNINAGRIATGEPVTANRLQGWSGFGEHKRPDYDPTANLKGRWPANLVLDEEAGELLDEQGGVLSSGQARVLRRNSDKSRHAYGEFKGQTAETALYGDSGGASRFFYCAKVSQAERNAGLETFDLARMGDGLPSPIDNPFQRGGIERHNAHPTLKPLDLNRYLARLLLPPPVVGQRRLLVPFAGVWSEVIGALLAGWDLVTAIERDALYAAMGEARAAYWLAHWQPHHASVREVLKARKSTRCPQEPREAPLFDGEP